MKNSDNTSPKSTKRKTALIIGAIVAGVIVLAFAFLAIIASTARIYDGVCVGEIKLGSMTADEAIEALGQSYPLADANLKLKCGEKVFDVYGSQIELKPDYQATAENAALAGKEGHIFSKIKNLISFSINSCQINMQLTCNKELLQYAINENLGENVSDVSEYVVEIGDGCLVVTNGRAGRGVNIKKLLDRVSALYTYGSLDEVIEIEVEDIEPQKTDADDLFEKYNRAPVDAVCTQNGDSITITPEVIGVELKLEDVKKIVGENINNPESYTIPAKITYPNVTAAQLEAEYTDCVIATYSTDYSTSSANRKENIRLAASKINGVILNPGDVFSFNGIVGPRTEATGYKVAHVYSGNKVVDGIGGGICQVSSTLYNAVVFADLEIVYRTNHSLPVSYVPLGRDATVSYGTIDFKLKNNKETPIKFEAIADGTNLTINVYGRKKYMKDISIETAVVGYIPFSVSEVEDASLAAGERVVKERGANGTRVEAYKIVKENGNVVSRTLLAKSSYSPTTQVEAVGTGMAPMPDVPAMSTDGSYAASQGGANAGVEIPSLPVAPEVPTIPDAGIPAPVQ